MSLKPVTEGRPTTQNVLCRSNDILTELGMLNFRSLYIFFFTGALWFLSGPPTMSPAYLAPSSGLFENSSYVSIQSDFQLQKAAFDPAELTASFYFLGNFLLGYAYCVAADRYGRRPILIIISIVSGLAGIGSSLAPSYPLMLLGRFIQGTSFTPFTIVSWVLCYESIPYKAHSIAFVIFGFFWIGGYCVVTPIARACSSWRILQLSTSLPNLLYGILLLLVLPESFGFLITKKKAVEAQEWVKRSQQFGGGKFEYDIQETIKHETALIPEDVSALDSFRHVVKNPKLMLYLAIVSFVWFVDMMIYTALSITSIEIMGGSSDTAFLYSGLVEIPCYFFAFATLEKFGRRPTVILGHVLTASAVVIAFLMSEESHPTLYLCAWLLGKMCITDAIICWPMYCSEIFPAQYRTFCVGFCISMSFAGGILGPYCEMLNLVFNGFMAAVFAGLCTASAALIKFLPETSHSD